MVLLSIWYDHAAEIDVLMSNQDIDKDFNVLVNSNIYICVRLFLIIVIHKIFVTQRHHSG